MVKLQTNLFPTQNKNEYGQQAELTDLLPKAVPMFTSSLTADLRRKLEDSGADLGEQLKLQGPPQELLKKKKKPKRANKQRKDPK